MASSYTAFLSYILVPTGNTCGYTEAIHCNYIKTIQFSTDNLVIQEINFNFQSVDEFKFLSANISTKTGYTVNRIYALVQLVTGTVSTPDAANWKMYDVTNQVIGYTGSGFLTPSQLVSVVYRIPMKDYDNASIFKTYNLGYLNYPITSQPDLLSFGDETFFFGNVNTDIEAVVYTTDVSVNLPLAQFNSTTNATWNGISRVYISEIGLYALVDGVTYLVAIGKLNDPVQKDGTISRTLVFDIDF